MTWRMIAIAAALGASLGSACAAPPQIEPSVPPPLSAAHGYHYDYRGMTLTYDAGLGVYAVGSLADHYFYRGKFYRQFEGSWYTAPHIIGPWEPAPVSSLPDGLHRTAE